MKPGGVIELAPRTVGTLARAWRVATHPRLTYVWLAVILVVGAAFRLFGLDWDQGQHLHPDERFLTMVLTALGWPSNLGEYFDSARNPLSPYNKNFSFFVYGTFPLYLVKWLGMVLGREGYDSIHFVGRIASAGFDMASVAALFFAGRRLYGAGVALLGAALLSLSVLNIQQSHFFTVDTFANFFVVLVFYLAVRASVNGHWWEYALAGIALGFGVASKVSVYTLGVVVAAAAAIHVYRTYQARRTDVQMAFERAIVRLVLAAVLSVVVFRILQPITFQGASILSLVPNDRWLANMQEVRELMDGVRDTPPGHQWTDRPALLFPWQNMVVWGMGLPLGLAAWAGWGLALYELGRHRRLEHLLPALYVGIVFLNQGMQFVKSMRYFLPLYPFLALFAAYLIVRVWRWASERREAASAEGWRWPLAPRAVATGLAVVVVGGTLIYALAFSSIYTRQHSRVEASRWIYANLPRGTAIGWEHWDDPLPLRVDGKDGYGGSWYKGVELPLYHEDNPEKLQTIVKGLGAADYVILSSNRLYDSIPRLPMRFPMTTRYYRLLFAGELGYEKVREFTSYPGLFGIQVSDQTAEEAFTVYDHPKVTVFRKTADFDAERVRRLLGEGIDWTQVIRLRADQASRAQNALMLTDSERAAYQDAGTWSELFDRDGFANQFPVLFWALALLAVGLLATPLTFVALRGLSDRGFMFARPLGLLLVAWTVWLLGSAKATAFDLPAGAFALGLLALASLVALLTRRTEMVAFVRRRWRLLIAQEALFWGLFGAFVLLRNANPDLWHPYMGGEKPMDFAYFNAVLKSAYFPPYDPWFAGGYINYYYFGFVLVAVLVKLTGIVPQVAYNLAVPTFFAFTGAGAFAVAYSLAEGCRERLRGRIGGFLGGWLGPSMAGVAGTLFVAVIGNLHELRMINDGLRNLSKVSFPSYLPGLVGFVQALDGARQVLLGGQSLGFRNEWWYWNATRIIDHQPNEAGPITEFPFFTFLYGDLHAHAMALPYTVLALAFAVSLLALGSRDSSGDVPSLGLTSGIRGLFTAAVNWFGRTGLASIVLPGLVVGALWPLNTWDFPTYLVIVGAALVCAEYARRGKVSAAMLWGVTYRAAALLAVAYLSFLPFHRAYASAYGSVEPWRGTRTPLDDYLDVHGLFLFLIASYLLLQLWRGHGHNSIVRALRLALRSWRRPRRASRLYRRLVLSGVWHRLGVDLVLAAVFLVLGLLILRQYVFALVLGLIALTGLLLLGGRPAPGRQFVLCLVGLGLLLTLVVEVVVLKGDISRMNTVFKFYLQVWTMWAVALAAALPSLVAAMAPSPARRGTTGDGLRYVWLGAAGLLVFACALYPWYATFARVQDRFNAATGTTLDGAAYLRLAVYEDEGRRMVLDYDRQAIEWLQDNIQGSPTIVEGVSPLYRWGSRVSVYTGLPTVVGWDWHQRQQRAAMGGELIDRRLNDVRQIYSEADPEMATNLLRRYGVRYIYVGPLERVYYPEAGLAKFERYNGTHWERVYVNDQVAIYRVP